ncbi:MAG: PAS domain-containing sensor histidine kinase [Acidimicrobiales bacterium]
MDDDLVWALVDAAPDALVVINDGGVIELVNSRAEELFGYHRSDLLGQPVEVLVPDASQSVHRAHRTRYRADPVPRSMGEGSSLYGRRADGSEFPIEISLSPVTSSDRQRIVAAVRDVSNRLETERNSRAIRHAIDTAVDGIFITDDKTLEFTYVNKQGAEMHGYTIDEMIGMTPLLLAPELDQQSLGEALGPLMAGETEAVTVETRAVRKDGSGFPVEIHINHPPAADNEMARPLVAVVRDISERVRAAKLLSDQQAMAKVLEDRERVAQDLHDRVIGDLFGLGLKLQATVPLVPKSGPAARIQESVTDLDDIIGLLRSTIFGLTTQPTTGTDVAAHLRGRISELHDRLGHQPVVIMTGPLDELPAHVVDEVSVIVHEALTNVAKHAQATATDVAIEGGPTQLTVTVSDNGIGLPDSGAHRPGGLGATNLRDRAERLGGTCSIEPGPAAGTTVTWSIPTSPPGP